MSEWEYLLREHWNKALEEYKKRERKCLFGFESNVRTVAFFSRSKGRNRKKRKYSREVILLSFDYGKTWTFINKRSQLNPFDQQIDEVLRFAYSNLNGSNPLDFFWEKMQEEVRRQLKM